MRLQAIKLSGFKSFVDTTTVRFPSNLCAVVGPNGCGKSNIIDAVRWVMGESSAKNLRGESMADVIFNGSTSRKPIGQASIELRFDNTEGRLTGEYASYNEISIQRKVTRDGLSNYYLNGQKCRRKDITDIFLGTGLGPRSYSIIEQGIISQLVEAKPEELRVFIEEAAGISKYKERRRETERRISHTRDNLDRLSDIREELDRQLHHLQRQARAAVRFKDLKKEERYLRAQLQGLRWIVLNDEAKEKEKNISRLDIEQEASIAEHRSIDAEIEKLRDQQVELTDGSNEVQKRYYDLGTEIARIEESIQHQQERIRQWTLDLDAVMAERQAVESDMASDKERIAQLSNSLESTMPQAEVAHEKESHSTNQLLHAEEKMHQWQLKWDEFNHQAAEPRQRAEVEQSRIQHLEESMQRLQERLVTLKNENETLQQMNVSEKLEPLKESEAEVRTGIQTFEASVQELVNAIEQQRTSNNSVSQDLDQLRGDLQRLKGRWASLEALQQAALGQQDNAGVEWLEKHSLAGTRRLAEGLRVEDGWEQAAETVLGSHLQAVCVEEIDALSVLLGDFQKGSLGFLEEQPPMDLAAKVSAVANPGLSLLSGRIEADWDIGPFVHGIYAADDLAQALTARKSLDNDQSIVTRDGLWLGKNWLRVLKEDDASAGVIRRQQELKELDQRINTLEHQVNEKASLLEDGTRRLKDLEGDREQGQRELAKRLTSLNEISAEISALQVQVEQRDSDLQRTSSEIEASKVQLASDEQNLATARHALEEAVDLMAVNEDHRRSRLAERDENRRKLEEIRNQARDDKDSAHQLALETQSISNQLASMRDALRRLGNQMEALDQRRSFLQESIRQSEAPLSALKADLATQLEKRLVVEEELTRARRSVEAVEYKLRELEQKRGETEEKTEQVRSSLERVRMDWQALDVRRSTLKEQLEDQTFKLDDIVAGLPEEANESEWEELLERMEKRIHRLGAINLAAIDEYEVQLERKQYLDAQNEDLASALETLQNAIRKIDRETRTRFKETFDQVNSKLQQLFPKLFGGGHAYLEMTGDDLLDTGVGLMARPPGKRNTSIHLLSGGEKALTAIALVFSIFALNPAPFCMLDEVDAPLDDANVGRYSELVQEMSRTVQFIYITHNKISMEMAHQLMGVTMHEPGVSRLVTVDVDEAVALAAV
jgi:chromosome segregation protein